MKNFKIELKWAIIFVLMSLIWMGLERLVGLHDVYIEQHSLYTNFIAIPAFILYYLAFKDKRENFYQGKISYGQCFKTGLIISVIVAVFTPLSLYISSNFITPNYFENATAYAVEEELMTKVEAEAYFNYTNYLAMSVISAPIFGMITSLIIGLFVKRK